MWLMTMKIRMKIKGTSLDTTQIDLGLDMDIILNKCVSVYRWLYVLSNT